jgi:hypothetical protein
MVIAIPFSFIGSGGFTIESSLQYLKGFVIFPLHALQIAKCWFKAQYSSQIYPSLMLHSILRLPKLPAFEQEVLALDKYTEITEQLVIL